MNLAKDYKGIILSTIIGLIAYFASDYLPSAMGSILVALLLGIIVGNLVKIPDGFQSGIGTTSSKLLELSILFLAFGINYSSIAKLGVQSFSVVIITVLLMLLLTYFLSKVLNCPGTTGWLVGFGTTICGSSAIAALAPSVSKNKDDIGIAMASVNLYGSLGMILLPIVLSFFEVDASSSGILIGASLHSVGNVAGAGYGMSDEVGEISITIKLARVALLSPALIFFNYLVNRNNVKNWRDHFKLPWYLWAFVGITVLTSLVEMPKELLHVMKISGNIVLTIALAAIGLKISFAKLFTTGRQGLVFGALTFALELIIIGLLMLIFI
jgi:uncharacterized integral membrane protein (TIGR00698 family)